MRISGGIAKGTPLMVRGDPVFTSPDRDHVTNSVERPW